jgi:hypothetical protein
MRSIVEKFIGSTIVDSNHRYKSWEHCYKAFSNKNETNELLALHLGFYLASWGMYRGSSGLLWKDYNVHSGAVKIIKDYDNLRVDSFEHFPSTQNVLEVFNKLKEYYFSIEYYKEDQKKKITATDTLISKIILGTLGCMPAFDRYFNLGFFNKEYSLLNEKSLTMIWQKALYIRPQLESIQEWILQNNGFLYPPMKIMDMFYWQTGFDKPKTSKNV